MKVEEDRVFEKKCGQMMPLRRDTSSFDGDSYQCACGTTHKFSTVMNKPTMEGMNGKFLLMCPSDQSFLTLIQTDMKMGVWYKGLKYVSGTKLNAA